MAHLDQSELVYANFSNDISIKPYAVFVDFARHVRTPFSVPPRRRRERRPYRSFAPYPSSPFVWQTLVVTIRGTLSLEDCITDVQADPQSLEEVGREWGFDGRGRYAHSGMLRSALWIRNDMNSNPRVAELLAGVAGEAPRGGAIDRGAHGSCMDTPLNQVWRSPARGCH